MKDVLSVVAFAMKALCFVAFLITTKPDVLSAVTAPSEPAHCRIAASGAPGCRSRPNGWSVESALLKRFAESIKDKSTNEVAHERDVGRD